MKPIQPYGDAGTLVLPWQDFSVPLYRRKSGNGQDIVDAQNAALIINNIDGGRVTCIADHAAQGFEVIKELRYGHPVVIQTADCSKTYRWCASMLGKNTGKYYKGIDGQTDKSVNYADLLLVTCNGDEADSITMVYLTYERTDNFPMYIVEDEDMSIDFNKYLYSTGTHYISNSGSDENGGYTGGKAGDQTGKEWQLKAWYNRPWTVVLRYPDQAVALEIAKLGIAAALNDRIGYDQSQRTTYWQRLKEVGYDPSKINITCEEDCTAGVSANVKAAGAIFGIKKLEELPICTSRNMRAQFTAAGFIALTASKYLTGGAYLLPGDILLYESHHAATNITLGKSVREQWNPEDRPDVPVVPDVPDTPAEVPLPCVEATGDVHVRTGPSTDYKSLGILHTGDRAPYFGYTYPDNGWLLIEYQGSTAWVSGKYARVIA